MRSRGGFVEEVSLNRETTRTGLMYNNKYGNNIFIYLKFKYIFCARDYILPWTYYIDVRT